MMLKPVAGGAWHTLFQGTENFFCDMAARSSVRWIEWDGLAIRPTTSAGYCSRAGGAGANTGRGAGFARKEKAARHKAARLRGEESPMACGLVYQFIGTIGAPVSAKWPIPKVNFFNWAFSSSFHRLSGVPCT